MVTITFPVSHDQLLHLIRVGAVTAPVNGAVLMRNWLAITPEVLQALQVCQTDHTGAITESMITEAITGDNVQPINEITGITKNPVYISSTPVEEQKKKRTYTRRVISNQDDPLFAEFWQAYPRKVGKDDARKAWRTRKPDASLLATMLHSLEWQRSSASWTKDGGEYIPHPATYLRQGRWQDERPAPAKPRHTPYIGAGATNGDTPYQMDCPHTPACSDGRWRCIQRQQMAALKAQQ
jgi:hypothetical protein